MFWFGKTHKTHQRRRGFARLEIETLESRVAPAILLVNASQSFVNELGAATAGDTLEIQPGATLGTLGVSGTLAVQANAGTNAITVNTYFAPGQIVTIGGANPETAVVDAVSGPIGGNYTLTLNMDLAYTHDEGATVTAQANTLAIDKGITIEGNPADSLPTLFSNITLQYVQQNGTPAPDALLHLEVAAVDGTTSSNLVIQGVAFNVASGTSDALNVVSGGNFVIIGDVFAVGNAATLATVVNAQTDAGAIAFESNTISVTGSLSADAVDLVSTSGPITVAGVTLAVSGATGGNGIMIATAGNASISGANLNFTGAVTDAALDVAVNGNVMLAGIRVTLGGSAGDGVEVVNPLNGGDLTASNLSVTADGAITGNVGDGAGIDISVAGSASFFNLNVTLEQATDYGVYGDVQGNLSISGTEKTTVAGAVADDGAYFYASAGAIDVASSLSVSLSSSAVDGVVLGTGAGNLTVTGAIDVNVTGAVSDGAEITSAAVLSLSTVSITLGSTANYGLYAQGFTGAVGGAINVSIASTVANDGIYFDILGVYLDAAQAIYGNVLVDVGGDVADAGLYASAGDDIGIAGKVNVTIGGTANYGIEVEGVKGYISEVAGATVNINGAVGADGAEYLSTTNLVVGGVTVNAADIASGTGFFAESNGGGGGVMAVVNIRVVANDGTAGAIGAEIEAYDGSGPVTVTNISVQMNADADDGVAILTQFASSAIVSTISANIAGSVNNDGILVQSSSAGPVAVGNLSTTLGGSAANGIYVSADGNLTVNGALAASIAGAVSGYGVYLYDDDGGISIAAPINVALNSTANFGVYAYADEGSLIDTAAVSVTITGDVASDAVEIYANDSAVLYRNVSVTTTGGMTPSVAYGVYLQSKEADLAVYGNISVDLPGAVSGAGLYADAAADATMTGRVNVAIGGTASYGVEVQGGEGFLSATGAAVVNITGAVSTYGAYYDSAGSVIVANVTLTAQDIGSASGFFADSDGGGGALTIANIRVVANDGTTSADGVEVEASNGAGPLTFANISVQMNAEADFGVYIFAQHSGNMVVSGVSVNIAGNVAEDGIDVSTVDAGSIAAGGLSATLGGTAAGGVSLTGSGNIAISGALAVSVTGALGGDGVDIDASNGDVSITAPVTVNLGSTVADDGFAADASAGSLTDSAAVTVDIAGSVTDDAATFDAAGNLTLNGNLKLALSGSAGVGLYAYSTNGATTSSRDITISVAGQITSRTGAGLYFYGGTGVFAADASVTLQDGSAGYGAYFQALGGNANVSNLALNVTGPVASDGLSFNTGGNIGTANLNVNVSGTAQYGIYANGNGVLTMNNTSDMVGGAVTEGAYLNAESGIAISAFGMSLASTSQNALVASAIYGDASINDLVVKAAGAISQNCVAVNSSFGNLSLTRSTITLSGAVTDDALNAQAGHGNLVISQNVIAAPNGAAAGIVATASGSLALTDNSIYVDAAAAGVAAALLNGTSGNPQIIENNVFNTNGVGTGLAFSGGASVVALVQGNNFVNNLVGVAITGDGTSAGDIDLGGGLLGSLGKNNFSGFTGASGHFAITLNGTNATSIVYALDNIFNVANPLAALQDQTENGGTGIIEL